MFELEDSYQRKNFSYSLGKLQLNYCVLGSGNSRETKTQSLSARILLPSGGTSTRKHNYNPVGSVLWSSNHRELWEERDPEKRNWSKLVVGWDKAFWRWHLGWILRHEKVLAKGWYSQRRKQHVQSNVQKSMLQIQETVSSWVQQGCRMWGDREWLKRGAEAGHTGPRMGHSLYFRGDCSACSLGNGS